MEQYIVELESKVTKSKEIDMEYKIKVIATTENEDVSVEKATEMMRRAKHSMYFLQKQTLDR